MKQTFAIGDVQGCLEPLQRLLAKIHYDPQQMQLWFAGDIVNRGPDSLGALRFIKALPADTVCVLGNHDLALLVAAEGFITPKLHDTFQDVLNAPDRDELLDWLRWRPLLHHDPIQQAAIAHAGLYPGWDLEQAKQLAQEVETVLRSADYREFLKHLFGNQPLTWDRSLTGWERLRFITNAFTRMRFCTLTGALNFSAKGRLEQFPELKPWFEIENQLTQNEKLLFGHWAALSGQCHTPNIFALDTGCAWGQCLTALCLQSNQRVTVDCSEYLM